jgi:amino acid transporter/nucleotide-binding universal stress UspA family protein
LKRQLNLSQVVMLGAAGTIGAQIFVLTGHAAGMAGPVAVLALLVGGLLSYSIALNYCELATSYPVAGGAMSYVREAYGTGLLSYLVGTMDCLSSTFYAALSAVGFAYSLQLLVPGLPIVPVAVVVVLAFVALNLFGVTKVGNAQVILGGILLVGFAIYIMAGFVRPAGFHWDTLIGGESIFADRGIWASLFRILGTIALVYVAYVGFEVIADDAEEVSDPSRNIPRGILISLTVTTVVYVAVGLVTLGTVPWQELAGSETALTDAVQRFIPGWGVPMMAVAGIIATLTSVNSAMLSATREAFTLGRDGVWPAAFSKLSRFRTPWVAVAFIGGISAFVAVIGLVDLLSYISSSGYLFVLFWGSLSMIRLRKNYPHLERPFKVPLFPLTAYVAGATCVLIIAFTDLRALGFGAAVLAVFTALHFIVPTVARTMGHRLHSIRPEHDRIVVTVANPMTAKSLAHIACIIAQASVDTYICVLTVNQTRTRGSVGTPHKLASYLASQNALLQQIVAQARERNVALYTKTRAASSTTDGILEELAQYSNVGLLLAGWPGPLRPERLAENPVKQILQKAHTNVAVLLNRGLLLQPLRRILVPVGGGPHSRLALRLAHELAYVEGAQVTALRVLKGEALNETEELEDQTNWLVEIIGDVLGDVPSNFILQARCAKSIQEGVLREAEMRTYNLIVMGASEEWALRTRLFGSVDDWVADQAPCSVLLCRRYEPVAFSWLRRQVKSLEQEYERIPP